MKLNWNFLGGGGKGGKTKKSFCGESMDIFWDYIIYILTTITALKTRAGEVGRGQLIKG